jgi:hypothetical protein
MSVSYRVDDRNVHATMISSYPVFSNPPWVGLLYLSGGPILMVLHEGGRCFLHKRAKGWSSFEAYEGHAVGGYLLQRYA